MVGTCSTHGRDEECIQDFGIHTRFWLENLKGSYQSEDLDVDGKKMFEWIFGK